MDTILFGFPQMICGQYVIDMATTTELLVEKHIEYIKGLDHVQPFVSRLNFAAEGRARVLVDRAPPVEWRLLGPHGALSPRSP
jgi:hypothetical protein